MTPVGAQEQVRARGGCLCGRVRYTVRGALRGIVLCHCGQCRRVHGHLGAYSSAARADVDLEGAEAIVWFASSERGRRGFCGICGSSLFFEPTGQDRLAIAAGSVDQPSGLEVIATSMWRTKPTTCASTTTCPPVPVTGWRRDLVLPRAPRPAVGAPLIGLIYRLDEERCSSRCAAGGSQASGRCGRRPARSPSATGVRDQSWNPGGS